MLIYYLFFAGLPLLALRQAIRCNDYDTLNTMWMYMLPIFRATNKNLYAKLCVHVVHTIFRLKPELRDIHNAKRTASLRNHRGRNVGWDFTLERMNLEVATLLGDNVTPERVPEVIRQLNGIRRVKEPALEALGIKPSQLRESKAIADTDVAALATHIKTALGFDGNDDFSKLMQPKANPFRTGDGTPWGAVEAAEKTQSTGDYVQEKLRDCVGNNMPGV